MGSLNWGCDLFTRIGLWLRSIHASLSLDFFLSPRAVNGNGVREVKAKQISALSASTHWNHKPDNLFAILPSQF